MIDVSGREATPVRSPMEISEPKTPYTPPKTPPPSQRDGLCASHKYAARPRSSHPSVCGRRLRRYSL